MLFFYVIGFSIASFFPFIFFLFHVEFLSYLAGVVHVLFISFCLPVNVANSVAVAMLGLSVLSDYFVFVVSLRMSVFVNFEVGNRFINWNISFCCCCSLCFSWL